MKADTQPTPTGANKSDVPSRPAGALANAARQVSRGSLLGGGEGKPSMASTVLEMANKAKSSAAASVSSKTTAPPAKTAAAPPAAAKPASSPVTTKPPPAAPKPSTSGATTPSTATAGKQETTTASNRRGRHDSQGRHYQVLIRSSSFLQLIYYNNQNSKFKLMCLI